MTCGKRCATGSHGSAADEPSRPPRSGHRYVWSTSRWVNPGRSSIPKSIDIGNEDFEVWDDCFSFPDLLVRVSRAYRIRVRYQDLKGEWTEIEVEGDRAELLQHEIDHLDGVLAVDRPQGLDPFCLQQEWHRQHGPGGRYGPPEPRTA